jgi:hypothetical protein
VQDNQERGTKRFSRLIHTPRLAHESPAYRHQAPRLAGSDWGDDGDDQRALNSSIRPFPGEPVYEASNPMPCDRWRRAGAYRSRHRGSVL